MDAEEITGVKYVVEVDTSGLDKLNGKLQQAGAEGQRQIGDKLTKAGSQASMSMGRFGEGTEKLRYLLASTGSEIGGVAGKVVGFGAAFVGTTVRIGLWSAAIAAGVAGLSFLAQKMSAVSESTAFQKFLDDTKGKVEELRKEAAKLVDALDLRGPGQKGLSETRKEIGRIRGELEAIEQRRAKGNKEVALPGTEDSTNTYYDKQKGALEGQLSVLLAAERDFQTVSLKEQIDANNKRLKETIAQGERELSEKKRIFDEEKRLIANMNEFRKWQRDQESEKLSMEYETWWAATQKWAAGIDAKAKYENDKEEYIDGVLRESVQGRQEWQERTGQKLAQSEEDRMRERMEKTQQWIDVAQAGAQAIVQVTGIFDLFGEKSAKSEEERAKAVGQRLAFENFIMAATETARAASSYPNVPAMVMHGIAAALHTAAAVKCLSDPASAGGFSQPSMSGGGAASRGAAMARDLEDKNKSMTEKGGGVVINIYGNQINAEGADKVFANGVERWAKKQRPGRPTGRL